MSYKLSNICKVIENLYNHYVDDIAKDSEFNVNAHVIEIIDFFKDQASKFVVKMNKRIAKAKAIKKTCNITKLVSLVLKPVLLTISQGDAGLLNNVEKLTK